MLHFMLLAVIGIKKYFRRNEHISIKEKAIEIKDAKMDYYLQDAEHRCKIVLDSIVTKKAEEQIKRYWDKPSI